MVAKAKVALAVEGRLRRKQYRKTLGTLAQNQILVRAEARYQNALRYFFLFNALHWLNLPVNGYDLDVRMSSFLESLWAEGEPKYIAADALSGLGHYLRSVTAGSLKASWRLYKAWDKCELPARAHPLLPDQVVALAGYFTLRRGMARWAAACRGAFADP